MDEFDTLIQNARRAAKKVARDVAEADDLAQEVVLRVWQRDRARAEGVQAAGARGLIRTILRRLRIDAWRRRKQVDGAVQGPGLVDDPLEGLQVEELREVVRDLVERLPAVQREAVRMRFKEGLTFQEIAERQGVSLNTALGRVHDAIKRMRQATGGAG